MSELDDIAAKFIKFYWDYRGTEFGKDAVRAVLRAIREPSDEQLELICCSMDRPDWPVHARQAWETCIDHLLADEPKP